MGYVSTEIFVINPEINDKTKWTWVEARKVYAEFQMFHFELKFAFKITAVMSHTWTYQCQYWSRTRSLRKHIATVQSVIEIPKFVLVFVRFCNCCRGREILKLFARFRCLLYKVIVAKVAVHQHLITLLGKDMISYSICIGYAFSKSISYTSYITYYFSRRFIEHSCIIGKY